MRAQHLRSLAMVCLTLLVVSCSSGSDVSDNANYAAIEKDEQPDFTSGGTPVEASAPQSESVDADPDAAPVDEFSAIVEVFDAFLSLRAQAITGEVAIDDLGAVATPQAIEQVAQLRSINDDLIARDSYAARSNLGEWSNVTTVAQIGDRYLFTDCTERHHVTPGGMTVINFVTNDVTMIDDNGAYFVEDVIETQDGSFALEPDEFGCVPPSFVERAEQTANLAVSEAARLIADPSAVSTSDLPGVFVGEARTELERVLKTLNNEGLSRTSDEIVELTVIGMDVNRPEFTVIVAVCRTYPQGRVFTTRTGEQLTTDLPVGSSYEEWIYVQLEPVPVGADSNDFTTVVEDRGPNCQKG